MERLRICDWSKQLGQSARRRARRIQAPVLHSLRRPSDVLPADYESPALRDRALDEGAATNRARRGESREPECPLLEQLWRDCRPNRFRWPVLSYQKVVSKNHQRVEQRQYYSL